MYFVITGASLYLGSLYRGSTVFHFSSVESDYFKIISTLGNKLLNNIN